MPFDFSEGAITRPQLTDLCASDLYRADSGTLRDDLCAGPQAPADSWKAQTAAGVCWESL